MDPCVRPALLWLPKDPPGVRCDVCAHRCRIADGKRGICGVRENRAGVLHTLVYGRLVSLAVDPIEKKPLFHLLPGSLALSLAAAGCNLRCDHCQNYSISQISRERAGLPGQYTAPEELVREAVRDGVASISYTYTEPTIFLEYALDVMELARREGLKNGFVTNGFMTPATVETIVPLLDAANVDLKGMTDDFYKKICGARLAPVLETIEGLHRRGVWVEVTTLVIPGHNDSEEELRDIARFLVELSPDIPWHVTGFHPTYKLTDAPPTPVDTLTRARELGLEAGLHYVYQGNRPGSGGEDTFCPGCGATVIRRRGFSVADIRLDPGGICRGCGATVAGLFHPRGEDQGR